MKKLALLIMLLLLSTGFSQFSSGNYSFRIWYENDTLKLGKYGVNQVNDSEGYWPARTQEYLRNYTATLVSFENKQLHSLNFSFTLFVPCYKRSNDTFYTPVPEFYDEDGNFIDAYSNCGPTYLAFSELTLPYYDNAKEIQILDRDNNDKLVLTIDVSKFSKQQSLDLLWIMAGAGIIMLVLAFFLHRKLTA